MLRIVPYAALHFMAYEQYRCWILNNHSSVVSGPFVDLLAGSAAGGTAVLCTYPLDLARTKLAYQVCTQWTALLFMLLLLSSFYLIMLPIIFLKKKIRVHFIQLTILLNST